MSTLHGAQPDLLGIIGRDTRLARQTAQEYAGPCPFCGGSDRLHVNLARGRWFCRQCTGVVDKDAIDYVRRRDGIGFLAAREIVNGERTYTPPPPAPDAPPADWQAAAGKVAAHCALELASQPKAISWLCARGISQELQKYWGLGFCCQDGRVEGIALRRGITVPLYGVDGALYGIRVRRATGDPKYQAASGSKRCLYGRVQARSTLLVVEGEFDCMLAHAHAGHLVDVATLGSCTGGIPGRWQRTLVGYRTILVAYDADQAGERGADHWAAFGRARRVRMPVGSDITDLWKAGGDIAAWVGLLLAGDAPLPALTTDNQAPVPATLPDATAAYMAGDDSWF